MFFVHISVDYEGIMLASVLHAPLMWGSVISQEFPISILEKNIIWNKL